LLQRYCTVYDILNHNDAWKNVFWLQFKRLMCCTCCMLCRCLKKCPNFDWL